MDKRILLGTGIGLAGGFLSMAEIAHADKPTEPVEPADQDTNDDLPEVIIVIEDTTLEPEPETPEVGNFSFPNVLINPISEETNNTSTSNNGNGGGQGGNRRNGTNSPGMPSNTSNNIQADSPRVSANSEQLPTVMPATLSTNNAAPQENYQAIVAVESQSPASPTLQNIITPTQVEIPATTQAPGPRSITEANAPENAAIFAEQSMTYDERRSLDDEGDRPQARGLLSDSYPGATPIASSERAPVATTHQPQEVDFQLSVPVGMSVQFESLSISSESNLLGTTDPNQKEPSPTVTPASNSSPTISNQGGSTGSLWELGSTPVQAASEVASSSEVGGNVYRQAYAVIKQAVAENSGALSQQRAGEVMQLLNSVAEHPEKSDDFPSPEAVIALPEPTADMPYVVHPNTCKTELYAKPEAIMAGMYQVAVFEKLVSMPEYANHKNAVIEFGDLSSGDHRTHQHANKLDVRSRLIDSPPTNLPDGPVFNALSPHYDRQFTAKLLSIMALAIGEDGEYLFDHIETSDRQLIDMVNAAAGRGVMIYVAGHQEHVHQDTGYGREERAGGIATPNSIATCEYVYQSLSDELKSLIMSTRNSIHDPASQATQVTLPEQPGGTTATDTSAPQLLNSPAMHGLTQADQNMPRLYTRSLATEKPYIQISDMPFDLLNAEPITQAQLVTNGLHSVQASTNPLSESPQNYDTAVASSSPETSNAIEVPAQINNEYDRYIARLNEMVHVGAMTHEEATAEAHAVTHTARRLLESLPVYDVIDPFVAYDLRVQHPGFSEYFPIAKQYGRQLTDEEQVTYLEATHRMVFGDNFDPAQRREMVEYAAGIMNGRESLGYPHLVKTFETGGQEGNASFGGSQILATNANIDPNVYEGARDPDENLDPIRAAISTWKIVAENMRTGRQPFQDWESSWKSPSDQAKDLAKANDRVRSIQAENIYVRMLGRVGLTV
jgi:hypothetical protein